MSKVVVALALVTAAAVGNQRSTLRSATDRPPTPELQLFAVNVLPRPCAYEGDDPFESRIYKAEGWEGPDYERYPGACQRLRFAYGPIVVKPGQNDVLIEPVTIEKPMQRRLHHPLQAEPRARRRHGPAGRAGAPAPRHVALAARLRQRPVLRRRRGEDDRAVPEGLRHAGQGDRQVAAALHGPLGGRSSRWRPTSPTTSTSSRRPRARSSASSPPTRSGSTCGRRAIRSSTSSAASAARTARARGRSEECAALRPVGQGVRRPGRAGQRQGRGPQAARERRDVRAIENFTGGTLIGIGGHLHPGGIHERDRPRVAASGKKRKTASTRATAPQLLASREPNRDDKPAAGRRPRGTSRCA